MTTDTFRVSCADSGKPIFSTRNVNTYQLGTVLSGNTKRMALFFSSARVSAAPAEYLAGLSLQKLFF
jgi:hypothetical protein